MRRYELVVFDMAGTTVLDRGNVGEAFINAFKQEGIDVDAEEVKKVMGWRKKDAIRILLEKYNPALLQEEVIDKIHDRFISGMVNFYKTDKDISALAGAEHTFELLKQKGIKIALNTGFTKSITDSILERLHWKAGQQIDYVISSDEVPEGRPAPYMIEKIMQALSVNDAGSVVKLGDTEVDVLEGRNAGCGLVIGVTTGAYTRQQLEQYRPDHIIDSLSELSSLIS